MQPLGDRQAVLMQAAGSGYAAHAWPLALKLGPSPWPGTR